MTGEQWNGKDLGGSGHDLIEILSRQFLGGTEENHKTPVRIANVLTKLWNQ
jgi:hypothetical protein